MHVMSENWCFKVQIRPSFSDYHMYEGIICKWLGPLRLPPFAYSYYDGYGRSQDLKGATI